MFVSPEIKKHYDAFWNGEAVDRACFYVAVRHDTGIPAETDVTKKWEDLDARAHGEAAVATKSDYLADGFPYHFVNFGPGALAAMTGGSYRWAENTVWFENEPFLVQDWDNPPATKLDKDSAMYHFVEDYTEKLLEKQSGVVSISDIGLSLDLVASFRGAQNLLYDLYDDPEAVKAFLLSQRPIWKEYFDAACEKLIARQGGMCSWMPIYSDVPYYPLQCDFSAMISPEMFGEFMLPDLEYHTSIMPRSIYHWDGPGEIPHLDHLLSLKNLNAIQWTPGSGNPDLCDECWFELYERIQKAGKSLILLGVHELDGTERLLKKVSTKGLFLHCDTPDEKLAKEMVRLVESYGVK